MKGKLETADIIRAKARISDVETLLAAFDKRDDLPKIPAVAPRKNYDTLHNEAIFKAEWSATLPPKPTGTSGVAFPTGTLELQSRFRLVDDFKLSLELQLDGRNLRIAVAGEEIVIPSRDGVTGVTISRKENALTWSVVRNGTSEEPQTKILAADKPKLTAISIRFDGVSANADGIPFRKLSLGGNVVPPIPVVVGGN